MTFSAIDVKRASGCRLPESAERPISPFNIACGHCKNGERQLTNYADRFCVRLVPIQAAKPAPGQN
jgi:hypothetical protein